MINIGQIRIPIGHHAMLVILAALFFASAAAQLALSSPGNAYDQVRSRFRDLFVAHDLTTLLTGNPAHRVALFLTACREARASFRQVRYPANYPDLDLSSHMHFDSHDTYDSV